MSAEGEWEGRRNREFPEVHIHLGVAIFFFFLINYFCLGWVSVAALGLSLATVSGGYSSLQCIAGASLVERKL